MLCICGISGLVGRELSNYFDNLGIQYIGTYNRYRSIHKNNIFQLDFTKEDHIYQFKDILKLYNVKIIIFCIVERVLEICENNWNVIKKVNIDIVDTVSKICNEYNIKFIHYSTDYVFDGFTQPNSPSSNCNPLQNYGISKYISECRVKSNCSNYCIIRTPVLYTSNCKLNENALTLISKKCMDLRKNVIYEEDNYSIRRPLYIKDLCKFIYNVIQYDYIGLYHFYNPYNKYTKYEICKVISEYCNVNIDNIKPNSNSSIGNAPRPYDTQLVDTQYDIYKYDFTDLRQSISDIFTKFRHDIINRNHKNKFFICLDLDGTILESNNIHYECYKYAFEKNGYNLNKKEWDEIIEKDTMENYCNNKYDKTISEQIKKCKYEYMKNENIQIVFTNNSDKFIEYLIQYNFNFCIVTNSSIQSVNIFKNKCDLLNRVRNWIVREDYSKSKPSSDCYKEAYKRYYRNEDIILCYEDTEIGYLSAKEITNHIYIYNNIKVYQQYDCYLIDDYKDLFE